MGRKRDNAADTDVDSRAKDKRRLEALMQDLPVPCMAVHGRLGGSAITVAAINALASHVE